MYRNGDSIPFMEKLRKGGRETALDTRPQLDETNVELWNMYCYTSENIMQGIEIYERRVGLPIGWDFIDCLSLVSLMSNRRIELEKLKND